MPVPSTMSNRNEHTIRIQKDPQSQSETRSWSSSTYSTQKIVGGSGNNGGGGGRGELFIPATTSKTTTTESSTTSRKSSDLFSDRNNDLRRGSNTSTTSTSDNLRRGSNTSNFSETRRDSNTNGRNNASTTSSTSIKSSSLVKNVMDDFGSPSMAMVPSSGNSTLCTIPVQQNWMGNETGEAPLSYEIVTKPGGKKEFQLKLEARDFNPEDLQVKVEDNTLIISGKHEEKSANGAFSSKSFSRRCTIPQGVRVDDLNCSLDSSGRMMITAPVQDAGPEHVGSVKTTTTVTRSQQPLVQTGYRISPGQKEQVVTVYEQFNEPSGQGATTTKTVSSSSKTVRSFKSVA